MSATISFKLTNAARSAIWNASENGFSVSVTHAQVGSGNRIPNGGETSLVVPEQSVAFSSGIMISPSQMRMSAVFTGPGNFNVSEVGIWSGQPGAQGSLLVGYWSTNSGILSVKTPSVDFAFTHDLVLDSSIPDGSVTIIAGNDDAALFALLSQHEQKADAHQQYLTVNQVTQLIDNKTSDLISPEIGNLLKVDKDGKFLVRQEWSDTPEW